MESMSIAPLSSSRLYEPPLKLAPLFIGSLRVDPPVLQAPMAGFTSYAFRQIVREFGGVGLQADRYRDLENRSAGLTESLDRRTANFQSSASEALFRAEPVRDSENLGGIERNHWITTSNLLQRVQTREPLARGSCQVVPHLMTLAIPPILACPGGRPAAASNVANRSVNQGMDALITARG